MTDKEVEGRKSIIISRSSSQADTHLCVEAQTDTHLSPLATASTQVPGEAREGGGGAAVRQEHVGRRSHYDSVGHLTCTQRHRQEVRSQKLLEFRTRPFLKTRLLWAEKDHTLLC